MGAAKKILEIFLKAVNKGDAIYIDNEGHDIVMTIMEYSKYDKERKYTPHSHIDLGKASQSSDEFIARLAKHFKVEEN